MTLDKDTLRYVLEVAKSLDGARDPLASLISRLNSMLEKEKLRLEVGAMARIKVGKYSGKYVVVAQAFDGGYMVWPVDDPFKTWSVNEAEIDFGGKGIAS